MDWEQNLPESGIESSWAPPLLWNVPLDSHLEHLDNGNSQQSGGFFPYPALAAVMN